VIDGTPDCLSTSAVWSDESAREPRLAEG